MRDEAASWAEKLKEVAEVLELWLEVQDLWQYLEAVFSNQVAARVTILFIYLFTSICFDVFCFSQNHIPILISASDNSNLHEKSTFKSLS